MQTYSWDVQVAYLSLTNVFIKDLDLHLEREDKTLLFTATGSHPERHRTMRTFVTSVV